MNLDKGMIAVEKCGVLVLFLQIVHRIHRMPTQVLRTTLTFVQYERIQTKIYTDITTQPYERRIRIEASFCQLA